MAELGESVQPTCVSAALDDGLGELSSGDSAIVDGGDHADERQASGSPVNRAAHLDPVTVVRRGDELGRDSMGEGMLGLRQLRDQSQVGGQLQRRAQRRSVQAAGSVRRKIRDHEPHAGRRVTPVEELDAESVLKRDGQRLGRAGGQTLASQQLGHHGHDP